MITFEHCFLLAGIIFTCGLLGMVLRRNLLCIMISIELMLNAISLIFIAASSYLNNTDGQIIVFVVATITVCKTGIGLAMTISLYKRYGTIETESLRILRG